MEHRNDFGLGEEHKVQLLFPTNQTSRAQDEWRIGHAISFMS